MCFWLPLEFFPRSIQNIHFRDTAGLTGTLFIPRIAATFNSTFHLGRKSSYRTLSTGILVSIEKEQNYLKHQSIFL